MQRNSPGMSVLLVTMFAFSATALADTFTLEGNIHEQYGARFNQSGTGVFVGLIQGPPKADPNIKSTRALIPAADLPTRNLCLTAKTFDGAYFASGDLRIPSGVTGAIGIGDPSFSRFSQELSYYEGSEVTVSFYLSKDCELIPEGKLLLIPATMGGDLNLLRVALNTKPSRYLTTRLDVGGESFPGTCTALGLKASAYRQVCDFTLSGSALTGGVARLSVTSKIGNAPSRTDSVEVLLSSVR